MNLKKITLIAAGFFIGAASINAQAVRDRNVIPVAVNLNQVLRMTITNGGNIEFTFNSIDDYRFGLSGDAGTSGSANPATSDPMYVTDFTIASSTRWELSYGSEEATFIGTDNPANTLTLDNVGFTLASNGLHTIGPGAADQILSVPTANSTLVADLDVFPTVLMTDAGNIDANAGDVVDNDFTLTWRCGTTEDDMNTVSLLEQNPSPAPDRYITNVLFELASL